MSLSEATTTVREIDSMTQLVADEAQYALKASTDSALYMPYNYRNLAVEPHFAPHQMTGANCPSERCFPAPPIAGVNSVRCQELLAYIFHSPCARTVNLATNLPRDLQPPVTVVAPRDTRQFAQASNSNFRSIIRVTASLREDVVHAREPISILSKVTEASAHYRLTKAL
jgi:hypothetical protein